MLLAVWLEKHSPADRELLKTLCDQYLATVIEYLGEVTKPPVFGKTETSSGYMKRMIYQPEEAMIVTFTTILDVSHCADTFDCNNSLIPLGIPSIFIFLYDLC